MVRLKRKISKEVYERALANNNRITNEDELIVFDVAERCGYGIYGTYVYEEDGEYYCNFNRGATCD